MKRFLLGLAVFAVASSVAVAASRTWTSSNGRFTTQAELINFQDGKAHLKKADGNVIQVALGALCDQDREFVKQQYPGVQEEHFRPGVEYRDWKSVDGKYTLAAEFLAYVDGRVQMRKADGSELAVALNKLSPDDQRFVREELKRLREEEKDAEKETEQRGDDKIEGPQSVEMKLVRLDPPKGRARVKSANKNRVPVEFYLRLTNPVNFFMQLGTRGGGREESEFRRCVRKEPAYNAPVPFRGVAQLGDHEYPFALDCDGRRATGYNKLYFDLNHNGDLTDDKPVLTSDVNAQRAAVLSQFPRIDLEVETQGKSMPYSFILNSVARLGPEPSVTVSLYSAAIRDGFITQGRKKTHLVLVDDNSNGRFDDVASLGMTGRERTGLVPGDLLLLNPDTRNMLSENATMGRDRHFVSKTVCLGKDFYRMEVSPSGDSLKLTPTELAFGYVTNPSPAYRAVVSSKEHGVTIIGGSKDQKIPLLDGEWKLASYTIATDFGGRAKTSITASMPPEQGAVAVQKAETAKLAFGAPFHAVVTAYRESSNKIHLSLDIIGSAGERCTSFYVNGGRPPEPVFVIKDTQGKTVQQGRFEYG